jgi:hypothetical protein
MNRTYPWLNQEPKRDWKGILLTLGLVFVAAPLIGAVTQINLSQQVKGILPTANGGTGIAFFTAAGPTVARVYTFPDAAATIEVQANKDQASGYAALDGSSKLTASVGQEVWALSDLTDVASVTGTGTAALLSTNPTLGGFTLSADAVTAGFALGAEIANEAGTGTTVDHLAKLTGAPSTAIITSAGDTTGVVGIVVGGAGTTGSAQIAVAGIADCDFTGATTAGNYVQNSATVAGECEDAGATYPTTGSVIGRVLVTNAGAGINSMYLFGPDAHGEGSGSINFADNETPSGTINGVNDTFTLANTVSPAASLSLYLNGQLQISGGGNDFTLSGLTITYAAGRIPQTGDVHRASYRY